MPWSVDAGDGCCSGSSVSLTGTSEDGGAVRMTWHGGLGDDVLRGLPDEVVQRPAAAAEQRAAADPRRLLGRQHDRLHAAPARLVDDRLARAPGAHGRRRDLDALVLLPHGLGPRAAPPARARAARRAARASIGSAIGTSKTHSASIVARPPRRGPRRARRRPAGPRSGSMSSSSGVPVSGTRIEPYSGSSRSQLSAASGTTTRLSSDLPSGAGRRRRAPARRPSSRTRRSARRRG